VSGILGVLGILEFFWNLLSESLKVVSQVQQAKRKVDDSENHMKRMLMDAQKSQGERNLLKGPAT